MKSIVKIVKNIRHLGKDHEIVEYFDENTVLLDFRNGTEHIYLKERNESYSVNHDQQQLVKIDLSLHKSQFQQLKRQLGEVSIETKDSGANSTVYTVEGLSNSIVLRGHLTAERNDAVSRTAYLDYYQYNNQFSMYELPLATNELIISNDTAMNISGKAVSSKFAVKAIEVEATRSVLDKLELIKSYAIAKAA